MRFKEATAMSNFRKRQSMIIRNLRELDRLFEKKNAPAANRGEKLHGTQKQQPKKQGVANEC